MINPRLIVLSERNEKKNTTAKSETYEALISLFRCDAVFD